MKRTSKRKPEKKRQLLNTGGVTTLTDQNLTEEQRNNLKYQQVLSAMTDGSVNLSSSQNMNDKSLDDLTKDSEKSNKQTEIVSTEEAASSATSLDWISLVANVILGTSEEIAGEQDENGLYDSDIQAMFGQSSSFSNMSDAYNILDDQGINNETAFLSAMNAMLPGVGGMHTNHYLDPIYEEEEKAKLIADTQLAKQQYEAKQWAAEGGKIVGKNGKSSETKGGEIKGTGTGKSDSIEGKIPKGSFIIPAEVDPFIQDAISEYMGYGTADVKGKKGTNVKVSDGELYIPPEDVMKVNDYVKAMGFSGGLNSLAPNAKHKLEEGGEYAEGLSNLAGYVGGAMQLALGYAEAENNKAPDENITQQLKMLAREVRQRATYGLSPYERTQAENAIANSIEGEKRIIAEMSGGDVSMAMGNMMASSLRGRNARLGLEVESEKMRIQKEQYADGIYMEALNAEERIYEKEYDKYLRNEELAAQLTGAGIANAVGQGQYNQYINALEKSNMSYAERKKFEEDERARSKESPVEKAASRSTTKEKTEKDSIFERIVKKFAVPKPDMEDTDNMKTENVYKSIFDKDSGSLL